MNANQVKIFITAAKYNSFSLAAQELFISQSAISYQIGRLEEKLKLRLFDRDSHKVRMAPSGESFYNSMLKYQDFMRSAYRAAHAAASKECVLRIGFSVRSIADIGAPYI